MIFPHLQNTSLWAALSIFGKRIETPQGIFYWSARAKTEAEIDGTIGIAQDDDSTISHLKIAEKFAGEKIMERASKAKVFGYAPIPGMESLRKKWLGKMLATHPRLQNFAALPVVTNGITHSLALAGRLFLESGQTLVTAEKSWENYDHIFTDMQGIKITTFPLFTAEGVFHIDAFIGACRKTAALQKKVVLLLNFPHNQTGFMPTPADVQKLADRLHALCREMPDIPFAVLLDDAYEGYVYDEKGQKQSLLSELFAQLPNFTIVKFDGISKVMLAYGYRIGFMTFFLNALDCAPFTAEILKGLSGELASKVGGAIRGEISQVNHHGQILADALMDEWEEVTRERQEIIERLKSRWAMMMEATHECIKEYGKEKIWPDPCNGGFFAYFNLAKGINPQEIAERLLKERKVGVVPSGNGLRVAFCGVPAGKIKQMIRAIFEVV